MEISKYFDDNYISLKVENNNAIEFFCDHNSEESSLRYIEPLDKVFLHRNTKEMFLVLNCLKYTSEDIDIIFKEWESRILSFIHFGEEYRDVIDFLKYNIFLLIICQDEIGEDDDDFRYQTEKSLNICRKVFLICDEKGDLADNVSIIPFYFDSIEKVHTEITENLEKEIEKLLPKDEKILSLCNDLTELRQDEIDILCGWLENENN